jgi:DNA-binding NtrC family response regulator
MEYSTGIRRMDVMLIDPDIVSRGNMGALVRDFGCYLVRPFEDIDKAVVSIASKPPAVVICNWDPDGENARALLDAVRLNQNDHIAKTPIILMSRNMDRRTMSDCLMAGATQFLKSPVVPADLMSKLVFVLKDKRATVRQQRRLVYVAPPRKPLRKPAGAQVKIVEFPTKPAAPAPKDPGPESEDILEI